MMTDHRAFPSLKRALGALAGMMIGMNMLSLLLSVGFKAIAARGIAISPAFSYLCSGVIELLCVGLPALLWSQRSEAHAAGAVRRDPIDGNQTLLIAAAAVLSVPVMNMLSALWCALLDAASIPYAQGMALPETALDIVVCLFTTAVIAPLCEEEFFRGRFFSALEPHGTRCALLVSTIFFALLHGQIGALPVHLFIGGTLGLLLVRRRSIRAAIRFHACYNGATVLLALIPASLFEFLMQGALIILALWMITLYAAVQPSARMYVLPGGRPLDASNRTLLRLLLALFALPYLLSMI